MLAFYVLVQVAFLRKFTVAEVALEGFLTRVYSDVVSDVAGLCEHASAAPVQTCKPT